MGVGRLARGSAHSVRKALSAARIKACRDISQALKKCIQLYRQGSKPGHGLGFGVLVRISSDAFDSASKLLNLLIKTLRDGPENAVTGWICCGHATKKPFIL
jgi:hypothetical protein